MENAFSNDIKQLNGVPQESILGSVCFVLFINDLLNIIKYSHIKLYADDVKIYFRLYSKIGQICYNLT